MEPNTELIHLVGQIVRQQMGDTRLGAIGHVIAYDPTLHAVRLVLPAYPVIDSLGNATGEYAQTGWIQLGTIGVGNGGGVQIAPHVGDPTYPFTGDQCLLLQLERVEGTAIAIAVSYNNNALPADSTLQSGEAVYKHENGNILKFHNSGDVDLTHYTGSQVKLFANGDVTILAKGNLTTKQIGSGGQVELDTGGNVTVTPGEGGSAGSMIVNGLTALGGSGGPAVARVGDTVICPAGTGYIKTGSSKVTAVN